MADVKADIILLPELCTTGYSFLSKQEALLQAEDVSGATAALFKKLAVEKQAVIVAGFAEKDGNNAYNSALIGTTKWRFKSLSKISSFFIKRNYASRPEIPAFL